MDDDDTLGAMVALRETLTVTISDTWTGYNPFGPTSALYDLVRDSRGAFAGRGRFAAEPAEKQQVDVRVSARAALAFFEALAAAPLSNEPMQPTDVLDDYPRVEVGLHVAGGDSGDHVVLFSTSTDEGGAPWGVFFGGDVRWSNSTAIGQALRGLHRPLQRSVFTKMLKLRG